MRSPGFKHMSERGQWQFEIAGAVVSSSGTSLPHRGAGSTADQRGIKAWRRAPRAVATKSVSTCVMDMDVADPLAAHRRLPGVNCRARRLVVVLGTAASAPAAPAGGRSSGTVCARRRRKIAPATCHIGHERGVADERRLADDASQIGGVAERASPPPACRAEGCRHRQPVELRAVAGEAGILVEDVADTPLHRPG